MSQFGCASDSSWILSRTLDSPRSRRLLQAQPFERIVTDLLDSAQVERILQQNAPEGQLGKRCIVVLKASKEMLDNFFNSASGYRAQYLLDPDEGNRANQFVLDNALLKVLRALAGRRADPKFVEASLSHSWAKVWIHQGLWLRHAKREHRVILVPTWQRELTSQYKCRSKLARWGSLAPEYESGLLLKGGYIHSSEILYSGKPPSKRAREIHELGFT